MPFLDIEMAFQRAREILPDIPEETLRLELERSGNDVETAVANLMNLMEE